MSENPPLIVTKGYVIVGRLVVNVGSLQRAPSLPDPLEWGIGDVEYALRRGYAGFETVKLMTAVDARQVVDAADQLRRGNEAFDRQWESNKAHVEGTHPLSPKWKDRP